VLYVELEDYEFNGGVKCSATHGSYCTGRMPFCLCSSHPPFDVYMTRLIASKITGANNMEHFWLSVVAEDCRSYKWKVYCSSRDIQMKCMPCFEEDRVQFLITVQQDSTYSVYYISVGSSTCFGCWHPSSGARTTVITASGIDWPDLLPSALVVELELIHVYRTVGIHLL
jgi:hypothetical protein